MNRIFIFIDGSNLYKNLIKTLGTPRIDYGLLINKLAYSVISTATVAGCNYYNAPLDRSIFPSQASEQQRFFARLSRIPNLNLVFGRLVKRDHFCAFCGSNSKMTCKTCGREQSEYFTEKEVDVRISVDMISLARKDAYDFGVLVSDDGDFKPVFTEIKAMGKAPVYAGFKNTDALISESHKTIKLSVDFFTGLQLP